MTVRFYRISETKNTQTIDYNFFAIVRENLKDIANRSDSSGKALLRNT